MGQQDMENLAQSSVFDQEGGDDQVFCAAEAQGQTPEDLDLHVWQLLTRTALAHPDREAVVSVWQPQRLSGSTQPSDIAKDRWLRWTYQQLFDKSSLLASALCELGCRPGMRLGALLWNSAEWALIFWATASLGITFAPIDPRDAAEARRMLKMIRADIVVVQDEQLALIIDNEIMARQPDKIRIQCSGRTPQGWHSLHRLCSDESAATIHAGINGGRAYDLNAVVLIVFTSGTSGAAKGCTHNSRNLISQTNNYDPNEDPSVVDRWLVHTPVSHIFAINNMLRAWRLGDTVVFPSKAFDVDLTIRALTIEECTIISATPTLVKALTSHPSFPGADAVKLNLVTIAATMVRVDDIRLCKDRLGAKDSVQAYGMSEGAPLISWSRTDEKLKIGFHPGVGKALPGAAIRICHPMTGKLLSRNEIGELHVSGPSVIDAYLDDADPGSFYEDTASRWLKTGDQAMMDSDDVVHILGRFKDIIIRGGENINPKVIEAALVVLPGVKVSSNALPQNNAGVLIELSGSACRRSSRPGGRGASGSGGEARFDCIQDASAKKGLRLGSKVCS
jgi:acyl-CoA synthetase (AMP-forming)/AMP-acid ligase II